ncbi:MAG: hypothetical protein LBK82_13225, partial [Planctomycetaceae bacterium]|nr:hypothetical protein [Planctomycetaceae bacterium]
MRNKIIFSFILTIFFSVSLFAQYPKDETIKPYPKPIKEKKLVQRFDVATVGWKALHDSQLV